MDIKEFLKPTDSKFGFFLFYLLFSLIFPVVGSLLNILVIPMIITLPVIVILMVYFSTTKYFISFPLLLSVSYYTACRTYQYKQKGLKKPWIKGLMVFLCITFVLAIIAYAYNGTIGVSCSKDSDCTSATEGRFCTYPANRFLNYDMLNPMALMLPTMTDCFTSPVPACVNKQCKVSELDLGLEACSGLEGFHVSSGSADRETGTFEFYLSKNDSGDRRIDAVNVSIEGNVCQNRGFSAVDMRWMDSYQINVTGCVIPKENKYGIAQIEIAYTDTVPGPTGISAGECAYDAYGDING